MQATKFEREDVLNELFKFIDYAVKGQLVFLSCPDGKALIKKEEEDGVPLLIISYRHNDPMKKQIPDFWMNESSLNILGDSLRAAPEKRIGWNKIITKNFK